MRVAVFAVVGEQAAALGVFFAALVWLKRLEQDFLAGERSVVRWLISSWCRALCYLTMMQNSAQLLECQHAGRFGASDCATCSKLKNRINFLLFNLGSRP
jgi:hypothetical protein